MMFIQAISVVKTSKLKLSAWPDTIRGKRENMCWVFLFFVFFIFFCILGELTFKISLLHLRFFFLIFLLSRLNVSGLNWPIQMISK